MGRSLRRANGVTLIELSVILVIVGLMIVIAVAVVPVLRAGWLAR